ncbi:MAG: isomaltose glucohydrolase [Gaiellaceae bacterium]|jgi:GH15 family glucan-1,4-alpha-glucosidase|nr:isomaltose glucohydrolase [Gaiellaceae bacterium]
MAASPPIARSLLDDDVRAHLARLVAHSISVIEDNQAATGAYPASPNFPVYRYCWFRDGAFIADAMSRVGRSGSADAFFAWCAGVVEARAQRIDDLVARRARREHIAPEEFLPCRYTLDGEESVEEWWEFQLDGYGTWLWSLDQHAQRHGISPERHARAVELTVRYLSVFWDEPCYDWWEEHAEHRHTSTLAALRGGLDAASRWEFLSPDLRSAAGRAAGEIRARVLDEGVHKGHLSKWLGGGGVDASLIACATPFRLFAPDEPLMTETVRALEREQLAPGGVHRYAGDTYFGGGEWLLLAAFLGWYYLEQDRIAEACSQLLWIAAQAAPNGDLPEQVSDHLLAPGSYDEWVERWGPIATPLLWSHAMFVTLAAVLGLAEAEA